MNTVILSGIIASAVQVRTSNGGRQVANFDVSEGRNRHNVAVWDELVKRVETLMPGDSIVLRGRLCYSVSNSGKEYANIVVEYLEKMNEEEFEGSGDPVVSKMDVAKRGIY